MPSGWVHRLRAVKTGNCAVVELGWTELAHDQTRYWSTSSKQRSSNHYDWILQTNWGPLSDCRSYGMLLHVSMHAFAHMRTKKYLGNCWNPTCPVFATNRAELNCLRWAWKVLLSRKSILRKPNDYRFLHQWSPVGAIRPLVSCHDGSTRYPNHIVGCRVTSPAWLLYLCEEMGTRTMLMHI